MIRNDISVELERALAREHLPDDAELRSLVEVADRLKQAFSAELPSPRRERAMFVSGIAATKPKRRMALLPTLATAAAVLAGVVYVGRGASPTDAFYPVRAALHRIGLAGLPTEEVDERIDAARVLLADAEEALDEDRFDRAESNATDALIELAVAETLLPEIAQADQRSRAATIALLEMKATDVIAAANVPAALEELTDDDGRSGPNRGRDGDDDGDDGNGDAGDDDGERDDDDGDDDREDSDDDEADGDDEPDSSGSGLDSSGSGSSGSGDDDPDDPDDDPDEPDGDRESEDPEDFEADD